MKILVTGGAGFIGSHTIKALIDRGDSVVCVDNFNDYYDPKLKENRIKIFLKGYKFPIYRVDITDYKKLEKIIQIEKPKQICHLAAQAGVRYSIENPFAYESSNMLGTLNLLELAKKYKVKSFIYASSSSVYGGNKKIPFSESDNVDNPISLYAASKKSCELMAHVYSHLFGIHATGLRFFTVYGPWGRPDMALFDFTSKIMQGKSIDVYNFGNMKRDFTYIDDIVSGILAALDKDHLCEIFNLGNSNTVQLKYFIQCIEKSLGKKAKQKLISMQPGDVPKTYADITKSHKMLGFNPKTKIEVGIKNFVEWYGNYHKRKGSR